MSTSPSTWLSKPEGSTKISRAVLSYVRTRNRQRAFDLVIRQLKKNGVSKADLAKRLDKDPAVISRLLSRPGNWELDTFSDLLFGISGAVPKFNEIYEMIDGVAAQKVTPSRIEPTIADTAAVVEVEGDSSAPINIMRFLRPQIYDSGQDRQISN